MDTNIPDMKDKFPYRPMTVIEFNDLLSSVGVDWEIRAAATTKLFVDSKCIVLKPEFELEEVPDAKT